MNSGSIAKRFQLGAHYSNKLYIAGTLGFRNLRYVESTNNEEVDEEDVIDSLKSFRFEQNLTTEGSGINFKFGLIYRVSDWVRIGAAVHTPTYFDMHDVYKNILRSRFDGGESFNDESPDGVYDYNLTTPFKAIGSLGIIAGSNGLISADYEYTDYSDARLHASDYSFFESNDAIRKKYGPVHTIKAGTEWKYNNFSFRAGTSFTTSPVNVSYQAGKYDFSSMTYSGGLGFRENNFFLDFGYVLTLSNEFFQPYTLENTEVPGVQEKVRTNNFLMTAGFNSDYRESF